MLLKVEPQDRVHVLWGIAALLLGGVIAGCAGMGGPFIVLWVAAHRWSNFKMRATILTLIASMIPFQIGFLTQFISHRLAGENLTGSTVTARARIMVQT